MRWLLPMICVSCGHASTASIVPVAPPTRPAPTAPPAPTEEARPSEANLPPEPPAEPPAMERPRGRSAEAAEPPLAMLAQPGDLFMLVTEDGQTRCRKWTVHPAAAGEQSSLVDSAETIAFESHGSALTLTSRTSIRRRESAWCGASFEVREVDGGLDVSGGRWFVREADCARALASKQRVATDLSRCEFEDTANLQQQAASQRTFEAMLRDGGTTYALMEPDGPTRSSPDCVAVHASPYQKGRRDHYEGDLWTAVRDGKLTGKTGFGYQLVPNELEMAFLGSFTVMSDGESGGAWGCFRTASISYGRDSVNLEQVHYLSLASCKAARTRERERQAWLPKPVEDAGEEPQVAAMRLPSIGGC